MYVCIDILVLSTMDSVSRTSAVKSVPITTYMPDPETYEEAMRRPDANKWREAIEKEVRGLYKLGTFEPISPDPLVKPINSRWVFKIKYNPDGTIDTYKASLVVRGDTQKAAIDYGEVFAPVAHNTVARMLLALGNALDLEIDLVDICQAFLHAELEEHIVMRPAKGVNEVLGVPQNFQLKLKRNLYGLKQAPRNWSLEFIRWLKVQNFRSISIDDCMYVKEFVHEGKNVFIIVLMYVDDNILVSDNRAALDAFKKQLHDKYEIVVT
jgi:hypothetical protein